METESLPRQAQEEEKQTGTVSRGLFFVAPIHSVDWQARSAKPGSVQTLFATGSGLTSSDLSQPGSVRHLTSETPADHNLTNEECRDMLSLFFSDIYPTPASIPLDEARSRYERRIAIARSYFTAKGVSLKINECNLRPNKNGHASAKEAKFKVLAVGSSYAVATAVPLTPQNIAAQKRLDAQEGKNAMVTLGNKMSRALAKAKTPEDCRHVMRSMEAHIAAHTAAKMHDEVKMLKKWLEKCTAKCDKLVAEQQQSDATDTDTDTKEEEEEQEDKLPCASHVIVATLTSALPLAEILVSQPVAEMQKLPPHPDFVLARVLAVKTPSAAAAAATEEKQEIEVVDVSTFDQLPTATVPGYLAITGTLHDCPLPGVWHELPEARVQTPCSVAVCGSSVLVADGHSARVISLPTGKTTGEKYTFYQEGAESGPTFKVFGCDMSATHVAFLGLTPGQYAPILVVCERLFLASARRKDKGPRTAVLAFSVPCNTVTLSSLEEGGGGMLNLGLSDGTLLRLAIPTLTKRQCQTIVVYPRTFTVLTGRIKSEENAPSGKEDVTDKKMTVESNTILPFDKEGLSAQLLSSFPQWSVSVTPFGNGDHIRWSGETLPLHRIVVKGTRAVASGPGGIFVFKLDKQPERAVHIQLGDIASFDFRGGLLAILKKDATIQLVNMHTYKLESDIPIQTRDGVKKMPAMYSSSHVAAVTVFDERILCMHADGSSRALEIEDAGFVRAPYSSSATAEASKASSFLPPPASAKQKQRKKK